MKTLISLVIYRGHVAVAIAGLMLFPAVSGIAQNGDSGYHTITDVKFYPEWPATLTHEQYVRLRFNYTTTHTGGVRIWARPLTATLPTLFSASSGSRILTAASGQHEQFFRIRKGETTVDQVRISVYTADRTTLLYETFIPVQYQYQAKPKPKRPAPSKAP